VQGKRTKKNLNGLRTVLLSPVLQELSRTLRARHPDGALFRNSWGRPWNKGAADALFSKLRARSARAHPEQAARYSRLVPYSGRHTVATRLIQRGHTANQVGRRLGNDAATVTKNYDHSSVEDFAEMVRGVTALPEEKI
jgi:integrase